MQGITLWVLDWKIPYWLIKIMFLEEVETAGIKSRFGILGFLHQGYYLWPLLSSKGSLTGGA